jgi:predicted metalloprotease
MREDDLRPSENVEDRRGQGGGFSGGGFPIGGGKLGIGAIVVIGLLSWALGIDPRILLSGAEMVSGGGQTQSQPAPSQQARTGTPTDQIGNFVSRVLGETEDVWSKELPAQANVAYQAPTLVLFSGATASGCGAARSSMGPFYCPNDRKVYLDTAFFQDMQRRFGGGGDFAYAYVISHEIGHHVQNLIGVLGKAQDLQRRSDQATANAVSVRIELMADCFAGVWANKMNQRHANIDDNDVRQAVAAASAIGDDRLQRQSQGQVVPDSFTHGSSEQRVRWLTTGLRQGTIDACNTFKAQSL